MPAWLGNDSRHLALCHKRWTASLNRDLDDPGYKEEWLTQQCLCCIFYIPLTGAFKDDWGACTNELSPFDRQLMFEHDGCEHYVVADTNCDSA